MRYYTLGRSSFYKCLVLERGRGERDVFILVRKFFFLFSEVFFLRRGGDYEGVEREIGASFYEILYSGEAVLFEVFGLQKRERGKGERERDHFTLAF